MTTTITNSSTIGLIVSLSNATYLNQATLGSLLIGGAQLWDGFRATSSATNVTIVNVGTILGPQGGSGAISLASTNTGWVVTNASGGVIQGATVENGIRFLAFGSVVNYGLITSGGGQANGIYAKGGASITNKSSGTLAGGGIYITGAAGTVINQGVILGDAQYGGVAENAGGTVTNLSGGTIAANGAAYGVKLFAAGTVTNAGTIIGKSDASNSAVIFSASGGRLIVDPGAVFKYGVNGGNSSLSVLELASGATKGTIALGANYVSFSPTVTLDSGASWLISAISAIAPNHTFSSLGASDTIDVTRFTATSLTTLAGGLGVVLNSAASHVTLHFGASISSFYYTTGAFGTDITTVCFCKGTQILTPAGEVGVESLTVGDLVVTKGSAEPRKITWIGKGQVLATRGQRGPATPVIVRKGALSPNVPNRDLHVTKAHSLYFDGVFVPAEFLVNHRSIVWDDRAQEVEIYHIELESHDILIANGAPAESYRDDGNRWLFQNANDGWNGAPQEPYAPVLTGGPVVDSIWARLLDQAGPRKPVPMTDDPDLHLVVDGIRLGASETAGDSLVFFIPGTPSVVEIASRDVVPVELGIARDSRALGVAVRKIELHRGWNYTSVTAADPRLGRRGSTPTNPPTTCAGPTEARRCRLSCWRYLGEGH